jgi:DNA polymerase phi
MNQSKKDDRFLHAAALAALKAIHARVEAEPSSAYPIFVALTTKHSTIELDRITKTKTLEQIILSADDETLSRIIHHLRVLIFRPESQDQATADVRRQTIADILLAAVKNYKHYGNASFTIEEDEGSWLRDAFDVLVEVAYFVPRSSAKTSKVPLPPVTDSTRKIYQERLSSCLTRLLSLKTDSKVSFALLAVQLIRSKATSAKTLELVFKADDAVTETMDKALQNIDVLIAKVCIHSLYKQFFNMAQASKRSKKAIAEGLILLYALALLQVYDGELDAVLLLDDINSSQKALLKSKKADESEGQASFVEIILSFLGNPRTLFRNIAGEAFSIFAADLSLDGLRSLTDVLDTAESLEGQRELFNQGDDEEEVDVESEDDVEDASDVEMVDGDNNKSDSDDSDKASSNGSDEEDDDEEDDEELTRFNELLASTLQTSKPSLNGAAEESSDDEDMDDEQMMALDPHLTKIFQERSKISSKKQQREDAKQTVVQFKSRVLDLLSIFMEKEYSSPLTLEVLLLLLRRIRASANKQLADKSYKILKTYTDSRAHHKAPLPKPTDLDSVWETLSTIHEEAILGGGSAVHATACSNASLHVVKTLVGLDKQHYSKIVDVYAESQKKWFMDTKSALQPTLFAQFQNWSVSARQAGK